MYNRVFIFGCSFTKYFWPTWADIVGNSFGEDKFYNFAKPASGNVAIFNRVMEANTRFKFTKDDLVLICWTNFAREDRYVRGKWIGAGNIFTQHIYDKEWVSNWFDLKGALIKSSNSIVGVTELLNKIGCEYHYTSMINMRQLDQYDSFATKEDSNLSEVFDLYKNYYDLIDPNNLASYLYNSKGKNPERLVINLNPDGTPVFDHHPNPEQHLRYAKEIILPKLKYNIQISDEVINLVNEWQNKLFKKEYWDFSEKYNTKNTVKEFLF